MRSLSYVIVALGLAAQVPVPEPQPQWLTELQKVQQDMHQAPLGSLEGTVEQAWRAALQTPQHPQFQTAARTTSSFYESQGYDLKAEQVLRQALAAVPVQLDRQARRNLGSLLAAHFERTQQLVKALAIREEMAKELPPPSYEAAALASLYERMGELEKAEEAWKEVTARRAAEISREGSGFGPRPIMTSFAFGYGRGSQNELASFYARHGRASEAEQIYKTALADASSLYEWTAAADEYIGLLSQQRRFDEAVDLIRQSIARIEGWPDPQSIHMLLNKRRHLASLLTQAGRPDEALAVQKQAFEAAQEVRELRASVGVPDLAATDRAATVGDIVGPAQQAAIQGNVDVAVAAIDRAVALAAERAQTNPQEVSVLMSLASVLMSKQQVGPARRVAMETLQMLDQAPDHPRVADALGSAVSALASLGMTAEAERALERQEKILLSAKGAESPALNAVGHGRIALLQRDANWAEVIEERKRMLARTEKATGPRSRESLYALREVAWAYPSVNNWPEEERVLSRLRERTASLIGESSLEHAHVLEHTANRASQNRQFTQALIWMDQAIEIVRTLPNAGIQLQGMMQERARIAQAKQAPPGRTATPGSHWFEADRFQRTDGTRLGTGPASAVRVERPAVTRDATQGTAVGAPATGPAPARAKP